MCHLLCSCITFYASFLSCLTIGLISISLSVLRYSNSTNLWQEGEIDLATVIKAAGCYRQSNKWDPVLDYVMVTGQEVATYFDKNVKYVYIPTGQIQCINSHRGVVLCPLCVDIIIRRMISYFVNRSQTSMVGCRLFRQLTSPVFFSTSEEGEIVQGLSNIPTDRPIMLVGYHMYLGIEVGVVISEVFKEKSILLRALAHPGMVEREHEGEHQPDPSLGDGARLFGAVPSYGRAMYKLLKHGNSTLLYPGGTREALHRKV